MVFLRALAVWLLIILAESVHGALRQIFLAPLVGALTARRIAFFFGLAIIFLIAYLFARWIDAKTTKELLAVGAMWMLLTAIFEFGLGYLLGYSLERILEDYDIRRGGLMGLGLIFMLFVPWLAEYLRRPRS